MSGIKIILWFICLLFISTTYAAQYGTTAPPPPDQQYQQNQTSNPTQQSSANTSSDISGMPRINLSDELKQLFNNTGYKTFKKYPALQPFDIPKGD